MVIRCLNFVASVSVGVFLVGCAERPELTSSELTGEGAKAAMINLLRSTDIDYMHGFPLNEYADTAVTIHKDGTASWADFHFDLKAQKYSYHIERGGRGGKGHFAAEYEGVFEFKDGKWVALKPRAKRMT